MKKAYRIIALLLAVTMLAACGNMPAGDSVKLNPADYETDEKIITILIAKNVLMVLWLKNVLFAKETTVRIVQIANLGEYRALNV